MLAAAARLGLGKSTLYLHPQSLGAVTTVAPRLDLDASTARR